MKTIPDHVVHQSWTHPLQVGGWERQRGGHRWTSCPAEWTNSLSFISTHQQLQRWVKRTLTLVQIHKQSNSQYYVTPQWMMSTSKPVQRASADLQRSVISTSDHFLQVKSIGTQLQNGGFACECLTVHTLMGIKWYKGWFKTRRRGCPLVYLWRWVVCARAIL